MRFRMSVLQLYRLILVVSLPIYVFGFAAVQPARAQDEPTASLEQFDLLSETSGWVLMGRHLFWTSDAGRTWAEISPAIPGHASVQDVEFTVLETGWILWSMALPDGSSSFHLAHTADRGSTWTVQSLSLFEMGEVASFAKGAEMGWFDDETGWISVRQATGSNFSVGTLFVTTDGGSTWRRAPLPVADDVDFTDSQRGWAVGGPSGDQTFRTQDGGSSWQPVSIQESPEETTVTPYAPVSGDQHDVLVTTQLGAENNLSVYSTDHSSALWQRRHYIRLDTEPGLIALSLLDPQNFVATIPGSKVIIRMTGGDVSVTQNQDGRSASIVELDMVSLQLGWGKAVDAACSTPFARDSGVSTVSCSFSTRLLLTTDGGLMWQQLDLPAERPHAAPGDTVEQRALATEVFPGAGNTQVLIGQGFDKCEIPTLSQLQAWAGNSPYQAVNLYIGGSSRACANRALNVSFLRQAHQQGWRFIPTWVGPQAPCTAYSSRISNDPTTAFNQGVTEANLATERLAELGLTYPDKSGSIVYYDIEHYGTNTGCRNAVNSFMNGWVSQLHVRGNLAGVYGSTLCNTGLSDFMNITHVPDAIWAARWYHNLGTGYHDPEASVWNLGSCLPNSAWSSHQRIRQYEGDHNESWGNVSLRIDSNVLDGVVAIPYGFFPSSISRVATNPTNAESVSFAVSFAEPVTGVDLGDFALSTTGVSGASINGLLGSGADYTVTVKTGSGNGTIRLDLIDNDSIRNASDQPLGGPGTGNGNFTNGKPYTIIKTATFEDVSDSHWAWQSIERLYAAGITGGCSMSPLYYCTEATVTRAQMAVFLERGIHGPSYTPPSVGNATGFADVPPDHWATAWIKQLALEGITGGCGGGNYCPDAPVTRAQMAVFLLRAKYAVSYSPPAVAAGTGFGDVPPSYWAAAWIKQLVTEGITAGCGGGNYCPDAPVTRAQMAVFLVRTFRLP